MVNLDEITLQYITVTFQPELKKVIYSSFNLLELFGSSFYEDKYVDLITRVDDIETNDKRDLFLYKLKQDMNNIIKEHRIHIDGDMEVTLDDLNEIVHFLYIVQNLEDYSEVSYILNSEGSNKEKLVNLVCSLSLISPSRLMSMLELVEPEAIQAMKTFVSDKRELDTQEALDMKRINHINNFFAFIGTNECLGKTFYENGYVNLTLEELMNIVPFSIPDLVEKQMIENKPEAVLDVLSLLVITKDGYELPLLKFTKNVGLFFNKPEDVTAAHHVMTSMISDFATFLQNKKELPNDKV